MLRCDRQRPRTAQNFLTGDDRVGFYDAGRDSIHENFDNPIIDRVDSPGLTLPLLVSQPKARLLLALDHDNFKDLLRKGKLLPIAD
jgi:hypothetical protein